MLNPRTARLAIRARLLATVVATTGVMTLSATATGYARAAGSFLDDGFAPGMEVTPVGFPTNPVDVITAVTALTITTRTPRPAATSAASRSLAVALPRRRGFDGVTLDPITGHPSLREEFILATSTTLSLGPSSGNDRETGLSVFTLLSPTEYGSDALDLTAMAIKARFTSGTLIDAGPHTIDVTRNPGPQCGQILPYATAGVQYLQVRVPWSAHTRTVVVP